MRLSPLVAIACFLVGLFCLEQQPRAWWQSIQQVSVGSAPSPLWDGSNSGSGWNVTNTGLTATKSDASWNSIFTTAPSYSSGKRYFRVNIDNDSFGFTTGIGFANAAHNNGSVGGADNNSLSTFSDGSIRLNGAATGGFPTFTIGNTVDVKADFDGQTFSYSVNGGSYSTPFSFAGINAGPYFILGTGDVLDGITLVAGGTPPSGYTNWLP